MTSRGRLRGRWERPHADSGFGVVEALVATAVALVVFAASLSVAHVQLRISRAHPGAIELSERARALADVTFADLVLAGSGLSVPSAPSAVACCLPAIHPRRVGLRHPDAPATARSDAITVAYAPRGVTGLRTSAELSGGSPLLSLIGDAPCPALPLCGLSDRDHVVVFDEIGNHDFFRVDASAGTPTLVPRQTSFTGSYPPGAFVTRVETHTYYFDGASRQLRHYDGYLTDSPVIDNVAGFGVEYWAEDRAPRTAKPAPGAANCLYDELGRPLPWPRPFGNGAGLVTLTVSDLSDGPWCGTGDNRFDADLLRIRRLRLHVRLEAEDALRAQGSLFARPGRASAALSMAADLRLDVDVAPRSLNAGR